MDINSFFVLKTNKIKECEKLINHNDNKEIIRVEYKNTIRNNLKKYKYTSILYKNIEIKEYCEAELIKIADDKVLVFAETEILLKKIQKDLEKLLDSNVDIENINIEAIIKENNNIKINKYLIKEKDTYFLDAKFVNNYDKIKEKTIGLQMLLEIKNKIISVIILNKNKVKFNYGLYEDEVVDMCKEMKLIA